jgi:hypothetical protein
MAARSVLTLALLEDSGRAISLSLFLSLALSRTLALVNFTGLSLAHTHTHNLIHSLALVEVSSLSLSLSHTHSLSRPDGGPRSIPLSLSPAPARSLSRSLTLVRMNDSDNLKEALDTEASPTGYLPVGRPGYGHPSVGTAVRPFVLPVPEWDYPYPKRAYSTMGDSGLLGKVRA